MVAPLVITGWSTVSAAGIGAREFSECVLSRAPIPQDAERAGAVPGFDVRETLGPKKTRSMDRITALTVHTVGMLLDEERAAGSELDAGAGLVLGITTGSVQSMMDFARDSFIQAKPYLVAPARFPNAVMNRAAGQSAIWHGLRGPNSTIASGQVAGLSAFRYAAQLLRSRHACTVLCGAVEELSAQRTWLETHRGEDVGPPSLGEGCAIFRLESRDDALAAGRRPLAELVATAFRVFPSEAYVPGSLADCVGSVLKAASASAAEVWAVAHDLPGLQQDGLGEVVGGGARRIALPAHFGDTGAASAALHTAAVLSFARVDPGAGGRLALVASVDRDGLVGVGALRLPEGRT